MTLLVNGRWKADIHSGARRFGEQSSRVAFEGAFDGLAFRSPASVEANESEKAQQAALVKAEGRGAKLAWALRHPESFPVDVNAAPRERLLRIPGIGYRTVERLLRIRRHHKITVGDLMKLRVRISEARHFVITADSRPAPIAAHLFEKAEQQVLPW